MSAIREIIDRNRFSNNCNWKTFKFKYSWENMYDVVLINSHSISYLGSRINNAPHYLELKLTFQDRRYGHVEDVHSLVK